MGNVLVVGSEARLHPTLSTNNWRHSDVHHDQPLVFEVDGLPLLQFFGQHLVVLGTAVCLLALVIRLF